MRAARTTRCSNDMSDAPDKESQTEEATEKRLHDSIEKGDTPHSREVTLFASLLASLLFCSFFFRAGAARLVGALQHMLDQSALFDLGAGRNASVLMATVMEAAGAFLLPAFVLFVTSALIASFGQTPPRLVVARIAPKWDRVSPRAGWSRLVSPRNATEFAKNLAKLFGARLHRLSHSQKRNRRDPRHAHFRSLRPRRPPSRRRHASSRRDRRRRLRARRRRSFVVAAALAARPAHEPTGR